MSNGKRINMEKWKQNMKMNGQFKPTVSAREVVMFKDVTTFNGLLLRCEKSLRGLMAASDNWITTSDKALKTKASEIYIFNEDGEVAPESGWGKEDTIGGDCKRDELSSISSKMTADIEKEVLSGITEWKLAYKTVKARMDVLEKTRLELDSRRRQIEKLGRKVTSQQKGLDRTKSYGEAKLEKTSKYKQHKETKLQASQAAYTGLESEIYDELSTMIKDSLNLKEYIRASYRIVQEAYASAGLIF